MLSHFKSFKASDDNCTFSWRSSCHCSFGACSTKEGSSSGSSQVGDFQSKNSCLAAAEKPGQVLVFLLPTQEGKTAAGVESRPRPPGANRPERSSRLKCTAAGVRGRLPPRLVPPATASGRCEHLDGLTSCREISLAAFTSHKSAAQVG